MAKAQRISVILAVLLGSFLFFGIASAQEVLVLSPMSSNDFGNVTVGTTKSLDFLLTHNAGSVPITVNGALNVQSPFSCPSGCGYSLFSGRNKIVRISFSPTSAGSVSHTVTTASKYTLLAPPLLGTGVAVSSQEVLVLTAASSNDFGNVTVGTTKSLDFFLTHNPGSGLGPIGGALNVQSPFSCPSGCGYNLAPGDSKTVVILFSPTSAGSVSRTVTAGKHTLGGPPLLGTGVVSDVVPEPQPPPKSCDQACPPGSVCIENPLNACSFADLIDGIINFIFTIALVITPIMVIIGGFMFITGGGDPAKITRGKQLLLWTVIGLVVILLAKGLVTVLRNTLGI